jgi:replicative DNA helicase
MKLSSAIQEAVTTLLLYDDTKGGGTLLASLLEAKTFDPYYRDIARETLVYRSKYGKAPGEHAIDIFESVQGRSPDNADIYQRIYESIEATKEGINVAYVVEQAMAFIRYQRAKQFATDFVDILKEDTASAVDEAEALVASYNSGTVNVFDAGTLLTDTDKVLSFLEEQDRCLPTGIKLLDKYDLGPIRGGVHCMIAEPSKGKSWWCVHLGKVAMRHGFRVLHVTLEMSESEVAQRYMQSIYSVAKRKTNAVRQKFDVDELGRFLSMEEEEIGKRPYLGKSNIRKYLVSRIAKLQRRARLIIKQFSATHLTIRDLSAYLDTLEATHNFIPDLIIVDPADNMTVDEKNYRISLGNVYKALKGLAQQRHAAVVTTTWANREGSGAKWVTRKHVVEDWSKVGTCDTIITLSQTDAEYPLGLARLYVDKGRHDVEKMKVLISQAYPVGQFALDEALMVSSTYWIEIKGKEEE